MKKLLLFSSIVLLMSAFTILKPKKVIFFGDSITQAGVGPIGYITKLQKMIESKGQKDNFELVGAGIGGNKIYDLYLRAEDDVLSKNPDQVIIYIGVNDVWHKKTSGTGTDPDKFEKFYNALIKRFLDKNIQVVLATPACIGEKTDFSNDSDGDMIQYSKIIRTIAEKNGLKLVDLRRLFLEYNLKNNPENKDRGILTTDRVHLNDAGNQLVADAMYEAIK
ncbi:MAG: SGNH/GDSL hydrolase family protein [Bacteroidota bacterium]